MRAGVIEVGALPPPDGAQLAQGFSEGLSRARRDVPLPPAPRDPALDEPARRGLQIIEAGLPDHVSAADHLETVAGLPAGLQYGVGFEDDTPGIDERLREVGRRGSGSFVDALLAADPALDGIGWAAAGPWAVVVLRAKPLEPLDGPAVQRAVEAGLRNERPTLRPDHALASLAAEVVADGVLDVDDEARFARAGGVPVNLWRLRAGPHLPTAFVSSSLTSDGPGTLHERWLDRVGSAARVTERGAVLVVVLATGEADRAALEAELAAAEPKATELVNQARAEAHLPPVSLDPRLVDAARRWLAEVHQRGCLVGSGGVRGCPGPEPAGADWWWGSQFTWFGADAGFTWDLRPAAPGDERLRRFGAAAALAADGTVWAALLLAE